MPLHPLAGKPAPESLLIDVGRLEKDYYGKRPDAANPLERVSFGTSGHRGTSGNATFTETHILAIAQAICEYRKGAGTDGPLFMGMDSHALSASAQRTALEVLAANGVETVIQSGGGFAPTPTISRAILAHNEGRTRGLADGIVITPSHNPPADGGFKYNPPNGGPADTDITGWVQDRANELIAGALAGVRRLGYDEALHSGNVHQIDLASGYIDDLANAIDLAAIRDSGLAIGVDPLGGASVAYWEPLAAKYGLKLEVVNKGVDPTFRFMCVDHDGKIRMDCSSPHAMAGLVQLKDKFGIAFGNDPDADRHGIVTPSVGLLNPNHFLCVAIRYLLTHRPQWSAQARVGKTLVSSGLIDRVVHALGREVYEVPVGFKWFAPGLFDGSVCFGGEESAGASFLRRNGRVWTTDKDGLLLGLLAAEITAVTGKDPGIHYHDITSRFGESHYVRLDTPASPEQKAAFQSLTPDKVTASELAGSAITAKLTSAAGNGASIGGLKVVTEDGWFAARPSGTENIYKLYAESFESEEHLFALVEAARALVASALQ